MKKNYWLLMSLVLSVSGLIMEPAALAASKKKSKRAPKAQVALVEPELVEPVKPVEPVVLPMPLDLSVPFKESKTAGLKIEHKSQLGLTNQNLFASENTLKTQAVQLDGRVLMTQDQEIEKRKSLDGAGIVINLRR